MILFVIYCISYILISSLLMPSCERCCGWLFSNSHGEYNLFFLFVCVGISHWYVCVRAIPLNYSLGAWRERAVRRHAAFSGQLVDKAVWWKQKAQKIFLHPVHRQQVDFSLHVYCSREICLWCRVEYAYWRRFYLLNRTNNSFLT
jgi:hypothetical protein